jgi:glycerate 2-kinase
VTLAAVVFFSNGQFSVMPSTKQIAREIFRQTLASIDIPAVMERRLVIDRSHLVLPSATIELSTISRVVVIAIGKAAHAMANGLYAILPEGTSLTGVVAAPTSPAAPIPGLQYFVSGHPIPDGESMRAAQAILSLLRSCDKHTLVFFLLSGGGSALVELSLHPDLSLEDVQTVHRALVTCGAPIEAMNTVRRHLSAVKGGRLSLAAAAAQKITLAVTDVPLGKEAALASGPTLPDPTCIADVQCILKKYDLLRRFPAPLQHWLEADLMPETPKPGQAAFANAHFELLLRQDDLFHAAHHATEAHGYCCFCDNSTDDWPVERAAECLLAQLQAWQTENSGQRVAIVADGEVSSPVTGNGVGGRNSAFVLACAEKIAGRKFTVLSAGTDGIDGNSPAAGAVADAETVSRANDLGLDPRSRFRESDAYTFFAKLDDAIITGPTGNNLRDLRILLAEP